MKTITALLGSILLAGCMSSDLKKSEQMLDNFRCTKIETSQMSNNAVTDYYQQSLYSTKAKAESYIQQYQQGQKLFDIPLTEVVQQQYDLYKDACQNLGGILATQHHP
ncbi:MAG TPA: hypothetical protein K8V79_07535 [Acinetobacter lwoffii]|uniref:Lipoprotein n=1 Tax=Acinetobacter lwoffii TaxID=28090 RepID=A0A9D2ZZN1_ACILW|nr:hypothetical protein [Acinetobacter sp. RF14B]MDM1780290.1 hypothetical protein [Acinetobacter indicus]TQR72096.1 hypothetical protein E2K52_01790 [Acinetobacter sp. RF14B]HJF28082.1 hypothetical protein [Acinetobacter lwoffii]